MKRLSVCIAVAAIGLAASFSAQANCNGRGCETPTPTPGGNNTAYGGACGSGLGVGVGVGIGQGGNGYGGAGGQGGAGGAGGRGGEGGSVLGSGNSSNVNANSNQQGQIQGQQQGQAQSSKNDNRSRASATGGRSNATGGNSQAAGGAGGNSQASNEGNNSDQSVTVQGDSYEAARIPVATAYAPALAATNGTCMGSSSVGAQGIGFGVSIGSTWNDESCDMRYDAEALRQAGMPQAAVARLCQKPEIARAMETAGTPCATAKPVAVAQSTQPGTSVAATHSNGRYDGPDPIVRKRLGLPPLN